MRIFNAIQDKAHRVLMQMILCAKASETFSSDGVSTRRNKGKFPVLGMKSCPPLCVHVSHIIEVSSEKKMVGSNAFRIVAFVAYIHGGIKWAVSHFVGKAMRIFLNALPAFHSNNDAAVPIKLSANATRPIPAGIGLLNLSPKSLFKWSTFSSHALNNYPTNLVCKHICLGGSYSHKYQ